MTTTPSPTQTSPAGDSDRSGPYRFDPSELPPALTAQDMIAHYLADRPQVLTAGALAAAVAAVYAIEAGGLTITRRRSDGAADA